MHTGRADCQIVSQQAPGFSRASNKGRRADCGGRAEKLISDHLDDLKPTAFPGRCQGNCRGPGCRLHSRFAKSELRLVNAETRRRTEPDAAVSGDCDKLQLARFIGSPVDRQQEGTSVKVGRKYEESQSCALRQPLPFPAALVVDNPRLPVRRSRRHYGIRSRLCDLWQSRLVRAANPFSPKMNHSRSRT